MEFSPQNPVVQRCLQGMAKENQDQPAEAIMLFTQAWNEARFDLEKFLAAYFLSRNQQSASEQLKWLKKALEHALNEEGVAVKSALPTLYEGIARCHETLGEPDNALHVRSQLSEIDTNPRDPGPFYHGTKADLQIGDLLTAGNPSNFEPGLHMRHVYFTAVPNIASLAAALGIGEGPARVYIVEPTGMFEHDPNVTDKKFPGNLTRSYRSEFPLKVVGELRDWEHLDSAGIKKWREKLDNNKGEIID